MSNLLDTGLVPARVQHTQLKLNFLELDSEVGRLVSVINVTLFD